MFRRRSRCVVRGCRAPRLAPWFDLCVLHHGMARQAWREEALVLRGLDTMRFIGPMNDRNSIPPAEPLADDRGTVAADSRRQREDEVR